MEIKFPLAFRALSDLFALVYVVEGELIIGAMGEEWVLGAGDSPSVMVFKRRAGAAPLADSTLRRKLGRAATALRKEGFHKEAVFNYGDRVEILACDVA